MIDTSDKNEYNRFFGYIESPAALRQQAKKLLLKHIYKSRKVGCYLNNLCSDCEINYTPCEKLEEIERGN